MNIICIINDISPCIFIFSAWLYFYIFFFLFEREGVFAPCAMLGGFPWVASFPVLPAAIVINNSVLYFNMSVFLSISIYSALIYIFYIYSCLLNTVWYQSRLRYQSRFSFEGERVSYLLRHKAGDSCLVPEHSVSLFFPSLSALLLNWGFFYSPGHAPLPLESLLLSIRGIVILAEDVRYLEAAVSFLFNNLCIFALIPLFTSRWAGVSSLANSNNLFSDFFSLR